MKNCNVTFLPDKKSISVKKGETLLSAAIAAGIYINSSCGGDGVCGRCKVIVNEGKIYSQASGKLSQEEKEKGYVLACVTIIEGDVVVRIPPESRLGEDRASVYAHAEEIVFDEAFSGEKIFTHSPISTKLFLKLPEPSHTDRVSDLERLYRAIRDHRKDDMPIMQTGLSNIRRLGQLLRSSNWQVTVTLGNRNGTTEIVMIEPSDTSGKNFGMVFDIGTTTLSGQLIDITKRKVLCSKITFNKQASFGADVISRIIYAQAHDGLEVLHHAVIDGMNMIIHECINEHDLSLNDITCCLCAGNTTMIHLLLSVDPTFIRREPYVPTVNFVPVLRAAQAGIKINPRGLLACVPGVSSYVGGDISAGVLACGMDRKDEISLLIDIGTNGEIVLGNKEWLICAAASAGPAFEGSGVACGMRAISGAIQRVTINPKDYSLQYETIGGGAARGICGSGYIDLLAEMLKKGVIDKSGKFNHSANNTRIREGEWGKEFVLVFASELNNDTKPHDTVENDIVITEADIENLKRAKGAIYAAASLLVKHMDLDFSAVDTIYIAGGFGTYLDIEKSIIIGLLPDVDRKKFSFIGNSSLLGARQALLSMQAYASVQDIAGKMTNLELSVDSQYMDEYMAGLFFPHTQIARFPSVVL